MPEAVTWGAVGGVALLAAAVGLVAYGIWRIGRWLDL